VTSSSGLRFPSAGRRLPARRERLLIFGLARKMRTLLFWAPVCALTVVISGCAPGTNAMVGTLTQAIGWGTKTSGVQLNPNFRYLRVTIDGRIVFLALGNVERDPKGPIEVWYSAEKEVVRLQNGRVVGAVGMKAEWREVSFDIFPSWTVIANSTQSVNLLRTRDVMPGYHYGIRDELSLGVIPAPRRSAIEGVDMQGLTWFEEKVRAGRYGLVSSLLPGAQKEIALPPARYAVDLKGGGAVVYGEQCLSADLCFTWQRWSANQQPKPATADAR
jgi:hypothetical protein